MAEICLECYRKLLNKKLPQGEMLLTTESYFCGECGEFGRIVVIANDTYAPLLFRAPRCGSSKTKASRKRR